MLIKVNDIELYYEVKGSGEPLIMVHGNSEDHTIFDTASEILAKNFTCYLIDSRGHGESTKTNNLDYRIMAEDIHAFIESLKLEGCSYYGLADGGIIGLIAASKYPELFKNLIISGVNTNPKGIKPWTYYVFKVLNFFHPTPRYRLLLEQPNITDDELKKIKCQTLVLSGNRDLVLEDHIKHIASQIPGAQFKIVDGESLGSYVVHREKIAHIITEFLRPDLVTQKAAEEKNNSAA